MKGVRNTRTLCLTGGIRMGKYTGYRMRVTHEEIAQLAYRLCELRLGQDGHHVEDWLRAERELMGRYA